MMLWTVAKHCQVLIETPESVARREQNKRLRRRYEMWCTCKARRTANGHCPHTTVIFRENIKPSGWRWISLAQIGDTPAAKPERSRLDLEREVIELRERLAAVEQAAA